MSAIHMRHIRSKLEKDFVAFIDSSDVQSRGAKDRENIVLSRALAAYALCIASGVSPETASAAVVDGFRDNGIDAIWFDENEHQFYVVQAKWNNSGAGTPELGDVLKMCAGFRDLLDGNLSLFNDKARLHSDMILRAIADDRARFTIVLTYTGKEALSVDAKRHLDDLISEYNDISELVSLRVINQFELHRAISGGGEGVTIGLEVMLSDWGQIREPYWAVYGQVSAADVARWYADHGPQLFVQNLRKVIQRSSVNEQIVETLRRRPGEFWYLNNGITALCSRIRKKPMGGSDRRSSVFVLEGLTIVNGAQTVGAISTARQMIGEAVSRAFVGARFISLEGCPEDFAIQVTRATNTQNRIESKDFAALDPVQERLRRDLVMEGKTYAYKTGDPQPPRESGCTIDEATIALACSKGDVGLAVVAKAAIGKLWEDIKRPPYTALFNDGLTGVRLWRTVEILRAVDDALRVQGELLDTRAHHASIHGNRFVAHLVYRQLPLARFDDPSFDFDGCRQEARAITTRVLRQTASALAEHFPNAYLQMFFKNSTRCRSLADVLSTVAPRQGLLF